MDANEAQGQAGTHRALIRQDERGRWTVRFRHGDVVDQYTALSKGDALDFADSIDRQREHALFAYQKGKAAR